MISLEIKAVCHNSFMLLKKVGYCFGPKVAKKI